MEKPRRASQGSQDRKFKKSATSTGENADAAWAMWVPDPWTVWCSHCADPRIFCHFSSTTAVALSPATHDAAISAKASNFCTWHVRSPGLLTMPMMWFIVLDYVWNPRAWTLPNWHAMFPRLVLQGHHIIYPSQRGWAAVPDDSPGHECHSPHLRHLGAPWIGRSPDPKNSNGVLYCPRQYVADFLRIGTHSSQGARRVSCSNADFRLPCRRDPKPWFQCILPCRWENWSDPLKLLSWNTAG